MTASATQLAFYDHKRAAHKSDFKTGCPECEEKWASLVQESKNKATSR